MHLIDCDTAEAYLRETHRIGPHEQVRVRRLAGGVSNEVLYVERLGPPAPGSAGGELASTGAVDFVLKQARPQLRVADPWFCNVERIWREVETLRVCAAALERDAGGQAAALADVTAPQTDAATAEGGIVIAVPQLLFEDRDNYAFAMTAVPPHDVWKQRLLAGHVERTLAAACGNLLAALHAGTWRDEEVAINLRDRSFFDDLRIDPYYRRVAQVHPDLAAPIAELIQSLADNCTCLVHGDFSPKNLLVCPSAAPPAEPPPGPALPDETSEPAPSRVVLVDFEVGHFGDPAFDLGFFLSHLTLKAFWSGPRFDEYFALTEAFWETYLASLRRVVRDDELQRLVARAIRNWAACLLARLDGKSKVEYLTEESLRQAIRDYARNLILAPPPDWQAVVSNPRGAAGRPISASR